MFEKFKHALNHGLCLESSKWGRYRNPLFGNRESNAYFLECQVCGSLLATSHENSVLVMDAYKLYDKQIRDSAKGFPTQSGDGIQEDEMNRFIKNTLVIEEDPSYIPVSDIEYDDEDSAAGNFSVRNDEKDAETIE